MAGQGSPAMAGPPVVMVHGLFGWGEERPLFGLAPPYFPLRQLRQAWSKGPVVAVDVGAASSDHDRACEAFAQLTGTRTDYGAEHAERCCHARFGPDFRLAGARLPRWSAAHPVHLVGHSFGGNTAVALLSLLAEDFWGLGTSADWVLTVTCICAPLRGCSLVYAIVFDEASVQPGSKLVLRKWSASHLLSIVLALFLRAQVRWPSVPLNGLYNLRCDHWGALPVTWRALVEGDHPYWQSGDNVAVMATPGHSRRKVQSHLQHLSRTRLIAVMADPLDPLSPGEALRAAAPSAAALGVAAVVLWKLRRALQKAAAAAAAARSALGLPALLLAGVALALRRARKGCLPPHRPLADRWQDLLEPLGPYLHRWAIRPAMRLLAHAVQKASNTLGGSDQLATRCCVSAGNDGLIDVAAQRWLDVPLRQTSRGKPKPWAMQRCVRSTGQELSAQPCGALANSFSQADVRGEEHQSSPLEPGKWRVLRIPGADHALGTSFSGQSLGMYRAVLELLETTSRHR